jgi:hypothetical protein
MVMPRLAEAISCGLDESRTVTVAVDVPAAVGVPLITPDEELMDNPIARPVADQAYGAVPPAALTAAVYDPPTVPFAREVVVITGGPAFITSVKNVV